MAGCANSQRDRALLLVTYESGARIGEIGRLTWKDIVFERLEDPEKIKVIDKAKIYIEDLKENENRYSRLTLSAPDLKLLKNQSKTSDDDYVFSESPATPMSYVAMSRVFQRAAKKAEINKPVRPHLFRHARATAMIREGMQESIIKKTLWNNLDTRMFKVYMSLGEDAIDQEMLKHTGIKEIRKTHEKKMENMPRTCGVCHTINPVGAAYCIGCGRALSESAKSRINVLEEKAKIDTAKIDIKALKDNPEFIALMKDILAGKV
jgi:integrase